MANQLALTIGKAFDDAIEDVSKVDMPKPVRSTVADRITKLRDSVLKTIEMTSVPVTTGEPAKKVGLHVGGDPALSQTPGLRVV